jgi:hypothetical protein
MKNVVVSLITVAGLAGAASADMLNVPAGQRVYTSSDVHMVATPLDSGGTDAGGTVVYSSIPGPYAAVAAGAFAQRDDYTSTNNTGSFNVDLFKFVGGVTAVGGVLDFFFLDNTAPTPNVVSSFSIQFPQAGNFIWTITFGTSDPVALDAGQLQIQTETGTTGQWFLTTTAASPGSNSFSSGFGSPTNIQCFEMQIPAPGSLALLGLGGLLAGRRRR